VLWTVTNTYTDEVVPVDLAAFDERRKRAVIAYTMGAMTREELAAVQRDLAEAQATAAAARKVKGLRIAHFDWNRPDTEVNSDLRALWREIRCQPGMRDFEAIPWTADVPADTTWPGASIGEVSRTLAAARSGPRPKASPDWAPADDLPF
jgi:hypothetical protein